MRLPRSTAPAARSGSLLIDIVLSIGIFGLVISTFSSGISTGQSGTLRSNNRLRALYLAEEGLEAVRSIRNADGGWTDILNPAGQYLALTSDGWQLTPTASTIDSLFTRLLTFATVNDGVRKITSTVTWTEYPSGKAQSIALETYLADWMSGPDPDWSNPQLEGVDGPHVNDTFAKVAISGDYAFVAVSSSTSAAGTGLVVYDISDVTDPHIVEVVHMTGAYDIAIRGNYAYLALADDDEELKILNISNPLNVSFAGGQNLAGTNDALTTVISGTGLYIGRDDGSEEQIELWNIESYPSGFSNLLDVPESADLKEVHGLAVTSSPTTTYVYAASKEGSIELNVFEMTSGTWTGGASVQGGKPAVAVVIYNTGAYLSTVGDASLCDIYGIDISGSKISNPNISLTCDEGYDLGGQNDATETAYDMVVSESEELLFLATNRVNSSAEKRHLQILDISNVHNISSLDKNIYNGDLLENYSADNGIDLDDATQTLAIVGGEAGSPGSYFIVLRPAF